jgi:hypothetical protein
MKSSIKQNGIYLLLAVMLSTVCFALRAGENDSFYVISGVVKDKFSHKSLGYAGVSVVGTKTGTVTNEDGTFSLKVDKTIKSGRIELSHVGYRNMSIKIDGSDIPDETYYLTPDPGILTELVVQSWEDPRKLIEAAIGQIAANYSNNPNLITGFYRETAQKRRSYINVSEAIINIYKTAYIHSRINGDKVQIFKGRQLLSQKSGDTLAVKLLGGPNLSIYADMVKNPDMLFDMDNLSYYSFKMALPVMIDDRLQFAVTFEPLAVLPYPLYYGTAYIDQKTLSFTRVEFSMDMKDRSKVTDIILKRKPPGLRFKPEELSFLVTYKRLGDKTYLHYMRNEIKFKCDWKRRLFATTYTVVSEMVATEINEQDINEIPRKETFKSSESLNDKVIAFFDSDFWGGYNIIEPSESLESAVSKLKKQYK